MALENPLYRRAWGHLDPADDPEADLQNVYINLILSEWQTSSELRMLDESHVRLLAKGLFQGGRRRAIPEQGPGSADHRVRHPPGTPLPPDRGRDVPRGGGARAASPRPGATT
jgi:hypothetical protein